MGERRFIQPSDEPIVSTSRRGRHFGMPYKKLPFPMPIRIPLSICCDTCSYYIRRGKTILARKEQVIGEEDSMGIPIYRIRFNCTKCSAPLSIKADHGSLDRVVESGATRMTEKEECHVAVKKRRRVRETPEEDAIVKSPENNVAFLDSKRALDDEMKSMEEVAVRKGWIGEAKEDGDK